MKCLFTCAGFIIIFLRTYKTKVPHKKSGLKKKKCIFFLHIKKVCYICSVTIKQ